MKVTLVNSEIADAVLEYLKRRGQHCDGRRLVSFTMDAFKNEICCSVEVDEKP